VIKSEHDGKTLSMAKQRQLESGLTVYECLTRIYYERYMEMFG
jgi:hypothetical protein